MSLDAERIVALARSMDDLPTLTDDQSEALAQLFANDTPEGR